MDTYIVTSKQIARREKAVIIRLDIQFNYDTQSWYAFLTLDNGHYYTLYPTGGIKNQCGEYYDCVDEITTRV